MPSAEPATPCLPIALAEDWTVSFSAGQLELILSDGQNDVSTVRFRNVDRFEWKSVLDDFFDGEDDTGIFLIPDSGYAEEVGRMGSQHFRLNFPFDRGRLEIVCTSYDVV